MPSTTYCPNGIINAPVPVARFGQTQERPHRDTCHECRFRNQEYHIRTAKTHFKYQHEDTKNNKCLRTKVEPHKLFCERFEWQLLETCLPCYLEWQRHAYKLYDREGTIPQTVRSQSYVDAKQYVFEYKGPWNQNKLHTYPSY
jgi:hypothetical protein